MQLWCPILYRKDVMPSILPDARAGCSRGNDSISPPHAGMANVRLRRMVHALLMLASDAGFTYAGGRLPEQAETSVDTRREHRTCAYGSMATALTGVAVMTFWKD